MMSQPVAVERTAKPTLRRELRFLERRQSPLAAIFGRAFLHSAGLANDADWFPIALVGWAVIWLLAALGIRPTTRSLLVSRSSRCCSSSSS